MLIYLNSLFYQIKHTIKKKVINYQDGWSFFSFSKIISLFLGNV